MFEKAMAQLRFATSLALGVPVHLPSLERWIDRIGDTPPGAGKIGENGQEGLGGPTLDEAARRELHLRRFRSQAQRAARETVYYRHLFASLGLNPARLSEEEIQRLPTTPKEALRWTPDDFVRRTARPSFRAMTTGTTGKPTRVSFSPYEMRTYVALAAIGLLTRQEVTSEDIVQISTSARASVGNTCFDEACQRIGARTHQVGLTAPEQALALLTRQRRVPGKKNQVSVLLAYPSYLGRLITCGLRLGYGPADFGLERIFIGGETVTEGLRARCQQLFGPITLHESFGMTEIWPVCGSHCSQEHLHFEASLGMIEVWDPETGAAARPGDVGNLVVTPFMPYRETTLLLRYDTEDMVRALDGPLTCEMRHLPATSALLGKRRLCVRHSEGWTSPRDVAEALEAIEEIPLPARFGFRAERGGVAIDVAVPRATTRLRCRIACALEARGVPLRHLLLVEGEDRLQNPFPLRGDLRESASDRSSTRCIAQPSPAICAAGAGR